MTSSTDQSAGCAAGEGGGGAPVVEDAGSGRSGETRAILQPEVSPEPLTALSVADSCYELQ